MSSKAGMVGFTIELSDDSSFILPPSQIRPVGEEAWAGTTGFLEYLRLSPRLPPNEYINTVQN